MSVVACKINDKEIEIAADSICVSGWSKMLDCGEHHVKLMRYNDIILGGCGYAEEISLFFHYMKTHLIEAVGSPWEKDILDYILEFKKWKANYTGSSSFDNSYILAYKGKAFLIEGLLVSTITNYCAIGAGRDYANGAMYCGASAKKAVEAACALCAMVAEPIKVEQMPCANK